MKTRAYSLMFVGITLSILIAAMAPGAQASSPYTKDVCASGCTYSSVQSAIDAITDSSATKIYTIFVDAGILQSDNSISFNGKDYIKPGRTRDGNLRTSGQCPMVPKRR